MAGQKFDDGAVDAGLASTGIRLDAGKHCGVESAQAKVGHGNSWLIAVREMLAQLSCLPVNQQPLRAP